MRFRERHLKTPTDSVLDPVWFGTPPIADDIQASANTQHTQSCQGLADFLVKCQAHDGQAHQAEDGR